MAEAPLVPHPLIGRVRPGREGRGVDAVADTPRRDAEIALQRVGPDIADAEHALGRRDGPDLPRLDARIGKVVEMMHRADEARDQTRCREIRQGIAADAVMGVVDVERAVAG